MAPSSLGSVAVVGSGISGLASAYLLSQRYRVTLFESTGRLGGHTNTVEVTLDGRTFPVDTGFLVFNERTYPNLIAMFEHLGVHSVNTEMSFSVSLQDPDLEWAGSNLATVFGQKRNLLRPAFWSMLGDILRFNREATAWLRAHPEDDRSLRDYLAEQRYGKSFTDWYLLPMAAAIWSCPASQMLDMPLATFVRFCENHGLLQIFNRPQWRTVRGGARQYVRRIADRLSDIRLLSPVLGVHSTDRGVIVNHSEGGEHFDHVVLACHSDQALALLGEHASAAQREVLQAVRYQPNRAVLHTDASLLPRDQRLWSAWNYSAGAGQAGDQPVGVSYLINRLQPLPFKTPVIVTLNPTAEPAPDQVIDSFDYSHPIFDGPAIAAQRQLPGLQGERGIWLAGAWGRYGFHEDGLRSALHVAHGLGVTAPWEAPAATPQAIHTAQPWTPGPVYS